MSNSRKSLAIAVAVVAGVAVIGALWLATAPTAPPTSTGAAKPSASARPVAEPPKTEQALAPVSEPSMPQSVAGADTTVVWPVKVELELIRGAQMPVAKDTQPIHSGANARLTGRILRGEYGLQARVTFTAGPNMGRQLLCNEEGEFGATDLWPGVNEVRVEAAGVSSVREVRLAQNREEQLNISYDLPGHVSGTVYDREGKPIEDVDVELDGQHTSTGADGKFDYTGMTGGDRIVLVLKKAGYASTWDRVSVAAGREMELQPSPTLAQQRKFTMLPGASLELTLGPRVGGRGDAQVILLPEQMNLERSYPWHRISPMAMAPGTTRVITDLPATRVAVRVFQDAAIAEPEQGEVTLREGEVARHQVRFGAAPALAGVVKDREGRLIENASVTYEVADRNAITAQYFGQSNIDRPLDREIVPPIAPAVGTALTNFRGEFLLSSWPKFGKGRYLTAQSADGKLFGAALVAAGTKQFDLILAPVSAGTAELSIDFPGRHQGLPIELTVNGEPRSPTCVPPNTPLRVPGLAAGTWRMRASWNGRSVFQNSFDEFDMTGDTTRSVPLPPGAISGQDAETRLRANPTHVYSPGDTAAPPKSN